MWFFTGKGDQGNSRLFDGKELPKSDPVFELIGSLDEATACMGLAISVCDQDSLRDDLKDLQDRLSKFMGLVAGAGDAVIAGRFDLKESIEWIEGRIQRYGWELDNPQVFIYAGKTTLGAALDVTRTVIRRCERVAVRYQQEQPKFNRENLVWLNRLSSFFFITRLFVDQNA